MNGPSNRRVSPSDLKRTKKALKKALRKEEKRHAVMSKLQKENEELHHRLSSFRNERNNFTNECC